MSSRLIVILSKGIDWGHVRLSASKQPRLDAVNENGAAPAVC